MKQLQPFSHRIHSLTPSRKNWTCTVCLLQSTGSTYSCPTALMSSWSGSGGAQALSSLQSCFLTPPLFPAWLCQLLCFRVFSLAYILGRAHLQPNIIISVNTFFSTRYRDSMLSPSTTQTCLNAHDVHENRTYFSCPALLPCRWLPLRCRYSSFNSDGQARRRGLFYPTDVAKAYVFFQNVSHSFLLLALASIRPRKAYLQQTCAGLPTLPYQVAKLEANGLLSWHADRAWLKERGLSDSKDIDGHMAQVTLSRLAPKHLHIPGLAKVTHIFLHKCRCPNICTSQDTTHAERIAVCDRENASHTVPKCPCDFNWSFEFLPSKDMIQCMLPHCVTVHSNTRSPKTHKIELS